MNLRTLKKLSKRAAALLPLLGDRREQFACGKGDGSLGTLITAHKHWRRGRCSPNYDPVNNYLDRRGQGIKITTRAGHTLCLTPPWEPRKGTIMVGGMSGGEQPEWDEETAWEALREHVFWNFTTWDGEDLKPTRHFRTPAEVFAGAAEIISKRSA